MPTPGGRTDSRQPVNHCTLLLSLTDAAAAVAVASSASASSGFQTIPADAAAPAPPGILPPSLAHPFPPFPLVTNLWL